MFKLLSLLVLGLLPLQLVSYDCPLRLEEGAHYEYFVEGRGYVLNTKLILDVNNTDENGLMTVCCKMDGGWYEHGYNLRGEVYDTYPCSFNDFTVVLDTLRNSSDFKTFSFVHSKTAIAFRSLLFDFCQSLLEKNDEEFVIGDTTWTRESSSGKKVLFQGRKSVSVCCEEIPTIMELEIDLEDGMLTRYSKWRDQDPIFEVRRR